MTVRHIVMFTLKAENSDKLSFVQDALMDLSGKIACLKRIETGINESSSPNAMDIVLVTDFDSQADLDTYRDHPEHTEALKAIKGFNSEIKVVDYTIDTN